MRSGFNLLVFPNSMFTPFLYESAMCSGEIALINNHYYYYYLEISYMDTGQAFIYFYPVQAWRHSTNTSAMS